MEMTRLLIKLVHHEFGEFGFGLALASPPDAEERGGHVAFAHPEGYAIVQALKARGVVRCRDRVSILGRIVSSAGDRAQEHAEGTQPPSRRRGIAHWSSRKPACASWERTI
jgi:hypothetical protein